MSIQGICMNLRIKGRGFSSFKFKNGKARHGSSVGLSCLTWLLLKWRLLEKNTFFVPKKHLNWQFAAA